MKSFVTKVIKSPHSITPFGGIFFINAEFNSIRLPQLIDNELGTRGNETGYSHRELLSNRFDAFFCGAIIKN
jgi:hypothetical protein